MTPPPFAGRPAISAMELCARQGVGKGRHAHPGREPEALCGHCPFGQELGPSLHGQVVPRRAPDEGDGRGRQLDVEAVHLAGDRCHQAARREQLGRPVQRVRQWVCAFARHTQAPRRHVMGLRLEVGE